MAGITAFTRIALGKETTSGTPVAPTRRFYGAALGNFDPGLSWEFHRDASRGVKTRVGRTPTQLSEDPRLKLQSVNGVGYDDLVAVFSMGIRGGQTGAGAGADKTWTFTSQNAATNGYNSFSCDVGDDVQNWRLQYLQPTSWTLSTQLGGLTDLSADCFAQRAVKGAAAAPAEVTPIEIPAELWTVKFATTAAGLAGAVVQSNFLRTFGVTWNTGLVPRHYADGNLYMAQSVETDLGGQLELEVENTALAISEFFDKHAAGTLDFVRLKATGPALGGTNYSLQLDLPVYWSDPKPLAGDDNGVNLFKVTGEIAYDPTSAKSLEAVLVCSLAAIP